MKHALFAAHRPPTTNSQSLTTDHRPLSTGLPIGNLTSQFFANLYLNELDYFVKHTLRCRYYLRYMDDFLVFAADKARLREIKDAIRAFLRDRLALSLHEGKSQIYPAAGGITFLGFRLFRSHRRLACGNVTRLRRRIRGFEHAYIRGRISIEKIRDSLRCTQPYRNGWYASLRCWAAHSSYAACGALRLKLAAGAAQHNPRFGAMVGESMDFAMVSDGEAL